MLRHEPPVVIVGAGVAGLVCAQDLTAAGIDGTVFEASDGVGAGSGPTGSTGTCSTGASKDPGDRLSPGAPEIDVDSLWAGSLPSRRPTIRPGRESLASDGDETVRATIAKPVDHLTEGGG